MEKKHPNSGQEMPDRRKFTYQPPKTDVDKARDRAQAIFGLEEKQNDYETGWVIERNWRGLFDIVVSFKLQEYYTKVFVYDRPTNSINQDDKVLHQVIPGGSISAHDLRNRDDLPKDDPILHYLPDNPAEA